jgi:putative ABC transport system permease protein
MRESTMLEWKQEILKRLAHLELAPAREAEIAEELAQHLEDRFQELQASGAAEDEARRVALAELSEEQILALELNKVEHPVPQEPDVLGEPKKTNFLSDLGRDLRYALRMLARNPGFTAVAVLTLALGIGANTAIFSVIHGVFLRALPYPEPDRLVYAMWDYNDRSMDSVGAADFIFWSEHSRVFDATGAYQPGSGLNLVVGDQAHYVTGTGVTDGLFPTLGVNPIVGRGFSTEEVQPHGPRAAILSYGLWQRLFAGDRGAAGRTVQLNGQEYTVVGIMPPGFQFVAAADVYFPLRLVMNPKNHDQNYGMVARLRHGVALPDAQKDMSRVFGLFKETYPAAVWEGWKGLHLISYRQELTGNVRAPLFILFGAAGLVLLIAVANVTSLILGRTAARQSEIAIRTAMGASGMRILRQLITEGVLLAVIGGGVGLLIAPLVLVQLLKIIPQQISIDLSTSLIPLGGQVAMNWTALVVALVFSLGAGIAAGLLPAAQVLKLNASEWLKQAGRTVSAGWPQQRVRSFLVISEIAFAMVLVAGAGLLMASFYKLRAVNPGFDSRNLWTMQMSLAGQKYETTAHVWELDQRILNRLRALPGVMGAASTSNLPVERGLNIPSAIQGCGRMNTIQLRGISPEYFRTMGIPLLNGRDFLNSDTGGSAPVAIISRTLARRCWPNATPLGAAFGKAQVIGVVGDTREQGLTNPASPTVYVPQSQISDGLNGAMHGWFLSAWVIRAETPLDLETVQRAVSEVDATQPIARFRPMTQVIAESFDLAQNRFLETLLGAFAFLALLLAAVGIYGVVSYSASQRRHEIGVRMSLGATRADVLKMVVTQGLRMGLAGVVLGLLASLAFTRLAASLLYEVAPSDPAILVAVSLLLLSVAALASYVPARRATRVDPMAALRCE